MKNFVMTTKCKIEIFKFLFVKKKVVRTYDVMIVFYDGAYNSCLKHKHDPYDHFSHCPIDEVVDLTKPYFRKI